MPRAFLCILAAASCLVSCRRTDPVFPRQESGTAPGKEWLFVAEGMTKNAGSTSEDDLVEEGFSLAATSSDSSAVFVDNVLWDSVSCLFKTASPENLRPTGSGITMDLDAIYPADLEISHSAVNYSLDPLLDVVAASRRKVPQDEDPVMLSFEHIMSALTFEVCGKEKESEYQVQELVLGVREKGSYDFGRGIWENGDDEIQLAASPGKTFYVFPGQVRITASWKCSRGGVTTGEYTKSITLDVGKGKKHSVRLLLSDEMTRSLEFEMDIKPWKEEDSALNFNRPNS